MRVSKHIVEKVARRSGLDEARAPQALELLLEHLHPSGPGRNPDMGRARQEAESLGLSMTDFELLCVLTRASESEVSRALSAYRAGVSGELTPNQVRIIRTAQEAGYKMPKRENHVVMVVPARRLAEGNVRHTAVRGMVSECANELVRRERRERFRARLGSIDFDLTQDELHVMRAED